MSIDEAALATVPAAVLEQELARRAGEIRRAKQPRPASPKANGEIISKEDVEARTVEAFCRAYSISRSALYQAWAKGNGPRFFYLGAARRISRQAGEDWVKQLEGSTPQTAVDDDEAA